MSLEDGGAVSLRESQNLAMETRSGPAEDSGPAPAPGLENIVADASPLDFVAASNEQESFGDLGFLSDQEKNDIDSVESVEEIFYLGEEESATKLELAYAYQKMGDLDGAIEILREVIQEGSDEQIKEAEKFIKSLLKTDK
jgi:pilus assembly protein FimV